ncbi:hypothetical protein [Pseudomonas sp. LFM046]|uniref:hypothetical protein n=1 Tax=Pseudomonas sp. LFM046 TaxID=1608357 RepID=UPI0011AF0B4B|nr:hypothetical protein [Pseudomonas sp. LFM046]
MRISKVLWLFPVSLLLYSDLLAAHGASNTNAEAAVTVHPPRKTASDKSLSAQGVDIGADHQKAIEAHVRHSNHQIRLLLRSASMSNIDAVLKSMDAIRQGNEACAQHIEQCRKLDASSRTADVSEQLSPAGANSKL